MDGIIGFVNGFQSVFVAAGETFLDLVVGIVPMVLVLLMVFNAVAALIKPERLNRFSAFLARNRILSYTVLAFISWFFLCNPMVYSAAKFLPQRQRASFIDVCATTNGPMLALFPHVNPAELFIWLGIAQGVEALGLGIQGLAIRFFIAGWALAVIRGLITEVIWVFLAKREGVAVDG
ncbi:MAG: PTS glucitol/sorbitol transporter subunit IIC [Clostridiales bacterium]|jgi:PTS system glucitol/sorbitol-specific IIC component|nr:PTS glucitol/sorbitol transporter subunit IIC [Clostridiales bacterium]